MVFSFWPDVRLEYAVYLFGTLVIPVNGDVLNDIEGVLRAIDIALDDSSKIEC
jgi:hypothetical protein